jgi:phage terminase small subunit
MGYLSEQGHRIYVELQKHCKKLKMMDIDYLELSMLANEFDCYARASKMCNEEGFANKHSQIRPEYTVMKTAYANILKHSGKFGLNPGDRARIFKGLDKKEKKNPVEGLD